MSLLWHKPSFVSSEWHAYIDGLSVCGRQAIMGGRPADARARMPSRATAKVCAECERKRPSPRYVHGGWNG